MSEKFPQIGRFDSQFIRESKTGHMYRSYRKAALAASPATNDFVFISGEADVMVWKLFIKPFAEPLNIKLYGGLTFNDQTGTELFKTNIASSYEQGNFINPLGRVLFNPTISDIGTLLDEDDIAGNPAGPSNNRVGFDIDEGSERIVAPNSAFLIRVANIGTNATQHYFRIFWSENRIV